jgi:hypothetical protein
MDVPSEVECHKVTSQKVAQQSIVSIILNCHDGSCCGSACCGGACITAACAHVHVQHGPGCCAAYLDNDNVLISLFQLEVVSNDE